MRSGFVRVEPLDIGKINKAVEHPDHYKSGGLEAIDVIEAFKLDRDFCLGNCAKYLLRLGRKDGVLQDAMKAKWYLDRYIKKLQKMLSEGPTIQLPNGDVYDPAQDPKYQTPSKEPPTYQGHQVNLCSAKPNKSSEEIRTIKHFSTIATKIDQFEVPSDYGM